MLPSTSFSHPASLILDSQNFIESTRQNEKVIILCKRYQPLLMVHLGYKKWMLHATVGPYKSAWKFGISFGNILQLHHPLLTFQLLHDCLELHRKPEHENNPSRARESFKSWSGNLANIWGLDPRFQTILPYPQVGQGTKFQTWRLPTETAPRCTGFEAWPLVWIIPGASGCLKDCWAPLNEGR